MYEDLISLVTEKFKIDKQLAKKIVVFIIAYQKSKSQLDNTKMQMKTLSKVRKNASGQYKKSISSSSLIKSDAKTALKKKSSKKKLMTSSSSFDIRRKKKTGGGGPGKVSS